MTADDLQQETTKKLSDTLKELCVVLYIYNIN